MKLLTILNDRYAAHVPTAANGAEEAVVQGRSMGFLREQPEIAEDRVYLYKDIDTIEEFDRLWIVKLTRGDTSGAGPERTCGRTCGR